MAGVVKKGFASADEVRTPDKTRMEIVDLGGVKAARLTAQPGGVGRSASNRSPARRPASPTMWEPS